MQSNNIVIRPPLSCITDLIPQQKNVTNILIEEYNNILTRKTNINMRDIREERVRQLMDFIEDEDILIMEELLRLRSIRQCLIQNITEAWDHNFVINSYKQGNISKEDMAKYFFYNEALCCIQTVIMKNSMRSICNIYDELDCLSILDHYNNAFMRKNAPERALRSDKYLIIDECCTYNTSDDILSYIKDNVILTFNDVKLYHTKYHNDISYKVFMDNLNKHCIDISYKSLTSSNIDVIAIGTYLKATYMVNNKQSIVYVHYNGTLPDNVRVPRHIKLEVN